MIAPDIINGIFEVLGGLFIIDHIRALYKSKEVKGVSVVAVSFFAVWGYWNLFYYPHLDQWYSTLGATGIALANTFWVFQMLYYIKWPKGRNIFVAHD